MLSFLQRNSSISIGEVLGTDINTSLFTKGYETNQSIEHLTAELKSSGYIHVISVAPTELRLDELLAAADVVVKLVRLYALDTDLEELLQQDNVITFGNNYILISTDTDTLSSQLEDAVDLLRMKGYTPVLVQAEQYTHLQDNYRNIIRLIDRGCLLQMEMPSLTGHHGPAAKRLAGKLLKEHWVSFVGSGISNEDRQSPFKNISYSKALIKQLQAHSIRNQELLA